MVATPNFSFNVLFLVRHSVAISVVTDGDFTQNFRELGHLIKYINLMWLFQKKISLFFFIPFFLSYIYLFVLFYFTLFYFSFIIINIIIVYIFVHFV